MKALIAKGHRSRLAGRVMLARPDWRPALLVASGIVGLVTAPAGRADPPPDFHQAPLSAASVENPYRAQVSAAQHLASQLRRRLRLSAATASAARVVSEPERSRHDASTELTVALPAALL